MEDGSSAASGVWSGTHLLAGPYWNSYCTQGVTKITRRFWGRMLQFFRGAWWLRLCCVGVNFGASGFVRFLGSLSFHLRGSGY